MISPIQIRLILWTVVILASMSFGAYVMHQIDESGYQKAENERIAKELEDKAILEAERTAIDNKRTKELQDANKKIEGLRYCLARGTCRLSIPKVCVRNADGSCVDDATTRTDIDVGTATNLVNLADRCDKITIQLNAVQDLIESWGK